MIESFWQDVRYALRALRQSPLFTAVALLTLALGIGANTAVFSVVNAVLLTPPPFDHPEQLVLVTGARERNPGEAMPLSYPNYADVRARNKTFEDVAAWTPFGNLAFSLTGGGEPERVQYAMGTASLFSLLRVRPVRGRVFTDAEDQFGGGERVAMVSFGLWARRFGSDTALVGRAIALDGVPYRVVGVLPPEFNFVEFPRAPDVWIPLGLDPISPGRHYARGVTYLGVIGRLRAGGTPGLAARDLDAVVKQVAAENPGFNRDLSLHAVALSESAAGPLRGGLSVLLGAVALVLLIACANVASLLLARATLREREIAVRLALGASRRRLLRSLLTESAVLGLFGGGLGVLVAAWGVSAFSALPVFGPASPMRPYAVGAGDLRVDGTVLLFTLAASLVTGALFGVMPALQMVRADLHQAVKASGARSGASTDRRRARELLVVAEIALSLVLLAGAGLLARSLVRLASVDPGFTAERVLALDLSLPPAKYPESDRVSLFFEALLARVTALPGVQHAAIVDQPPLGGPVQSTDYRVAGGAAPAPGTQRGLPYSVASAEYFRTMGIGLVAGRQLSSRDAARSPRVVVINEAAARELWPGENPIGRRFTLSTEAIHIGPQGQPSWDWEGAAREVVGVVHDVRHDALSVAPAPEAYVPFAQSPVRVLTLLVRAGGEPASLLASIRRELRALDPDQPVSHVRTMGDVVATSIGAPRFRTLLFAVFAALALVLAAVGIYGVTAYAVTARTREIGIRSALGAARGQLTRLVLRDGLRLATAGIGLGIVGALAGARALRGMLYDMSATDAPTFVAASALLALVALIACWIPARRAARIEPAVALREE